jgi:ABC-type polar amino acid transport system ATPase subunit
MVKLAEDGTTIAVVTHEMGFARRVPIGGKSWNRARQSEMFDAPDEPRTRKLISSLM